MTRPFEIEGERITLNVHPIERAALATIPAMLEAGDDAGGRLDYSAHPDDPDADRRYRELVAGDLDDLRREDRATFAAVLDGASMSHDDLAALMRVVGEVRIVLAARLGIEDDGWEDDVVPSDPEMALLGWLGWLQDSAVRILTDQL